MEGFELLFIFLAFIALKASLQPDSVTPFGIALSAGVALFLLVAGGTLLFVIGNLAGAFMLIGAIWLIIFGLIFVIRRRLPKR